MTIIKDIIDELIVSKEKRLAELWKEIKDIKKIESIDLEKKFDEEVKEEKLSTGTLIDNLIGGGLEVGSSMLLFGEYGSGKTQTCFTMAVLCPDIVIYIDTEGSFKASRIKEICDARKLDYKQIFKKIKLYQPKNWIEQMYILGNLPSPTDVDGKIGLIIVDSLTKQLRGIEFSGRQALDEKQPLVREYILSLEEISRVYGAAFIYTTQIYESPTSNPYLPDWTGQKPVGGASILHQADYVLFFRKAQGTTRIARLLDASWQALKERPFQINASGIDDLPQTEKSAEMIGKTHEYEEKLQGAMEGSSKKKKTAEEKSTESTETKEGK